MHSSVTFALLSEVDKNILGNLENDQYILVRKWIIELILATDMGRHFELIGIFKSKYYTSQSLDSPECKLDVLKMLIKSADIGHAAKTTELHVNWSLLISEEFFRQGDIEKEAGKTVSMYCDRETTIIPKSQIGFLKNIALPLYEAVNIYLNSDSFEANCIEQIKNNISSWENQAALMNSNTLNDHQINKLMSGVHSSFSAEGHKSHSDILSAK